MPTAVRTQSLLHTQLIADASAELCKTELCEKGRPYRVPCEDEGEYNCSKKLIPERAKLDCMACQDKGLSSKNSRGQQDRRSTSSHSSSSRREKRAPVKASDAAIKRAEIFSSHKPIFGKANASMSTRSYSHKDSSPYRSSSREYESSTKGVKRRWNDCEYFDEEHGVQHDPVHEDWRGPSKGAHGAKAANRLRQPVEEWVSSQHLEASNVEEVVDRDGQGFQERFEDGDEPLGDKNVEVEKPRVYIDDLIYAQARNLPLDPEDLPGVEQPRGRVKNPHIENIRDGSCAGERSRSRSTHSKQSTRHT